MATIKCFEELEIWKLARSLSQEIFEAWNRSELFQKDYGLKDQINKSSGSIMDNIAEGFNRGGRTEFIQFLYIAKGSGAEVKSQLHRALDRGYLSQEQFDDLYVRTNEICYKIGSFIRYLKNTEHKGVKFKPVTQTQNTKPKTQHS